jgi:protein phosphatase
LLRAADTIERTDTGRQRRGNEDASYARAPLFVVADGMGGAQAGEVASQVAVQQFEQGLSGDGPPEERLSHAVQRANHEIYELSHADAARAGMGTTLTAAYLDEDRVAIAHVGDSRAYLLRDGELTRLTEDHSLVEELRRKGKLTEEEALEHPQRSVITRALGIEPTVEVDTWSYPVRAGDVVLLCSDGLTSMIAEGEVKRALIESPNVATAADRLIDEANAAGGRDNITVILFRVEEAGDGAFVDQPTVVSGRAPVLPGGEATGSVATAAPVAREPPPAEAPDQDAPSAGAPRAGAPGAAGPPETRRARLARTQGWTRPAERPRHFGKLGKFVAGLVATAVVLFLIGAGGYLASRQLYFLGTNAQGTVVVFRGFPYVLPFGIPLYETYYVSGVPASSIPADRRGTLLNHNLRSQRAAESLINTLEVGKISG